MFGYLIKLRKYENIVQDIITLIKYRLCDMVHVTLLWNYFKIFTDFA